MQVHTASIALGSNLGDRAEYIRLAIQSIDRLPLVTVLRASSLREYPPLSAPGVEPGGPYLNACALLQTQHEPLTLLEHLHAIERALGRQRTPGARWAPRTIDLDLLTFGDRTAQDPRLILPHPRMHERLFVLEPLAEIAPDLPVPAHGTVTQALERLVHRSEEP